MITSGDAIDVLRYSVGKTVKSNIGKPLFEKTPYEADTDTDSDDSIIYDIESQVDIIDDDMIPDGFAGHVIRFDSNGGSHVRTELVSEGGTTYPPVEPDKDGFIFDGWYLNENDAHSFVFGEILDTDITLKARWADKSFFLKISDNSVVIPADGEGKQVRLTLVTAQNAPNGIEVKYGTEGNMTNTVRLLDNAQPENGDDIMGDGVYSAYVDLFEEETEIFFSAQLGQSDSNVVSVRTYSSVPVNKGDPVRYVIQELDELEGTKGYKDKSAEERKYDVLKIIDDYKTNGIVESVTVSGEQYAISFVTYKGISGTYYYDGTFFDVTDLDRNKLTTDIILDEIQTLSDSSGFWDLPAEDRKNAALKIIDRYEIQGLIRDVVVSEDNYDITFIDSYGISSGFYYDGFMARLGENKDPEILDLKTPSSISTSSSSKSYGGACVMNSFSFFSDSTSLHASEAESVIEMSAEWSPNHTIINNPTLEDYRHLDDYDIVCILTHGNTFEFEDGITGKKTVFPCIIIPASSVGDESADSLEKLSDNNEIKVYRNIVAISPLFFINNYEKYDLSNTEICAACCYSLGGDNGGYPLDYNYYLANAFLSRGASQLVGLKTV